MKPERAFAWRLRWLLEREPSIGLEEVAEALDSPIDRAHALAWGDEYPSSDDIDRVSKLYRMSREWMLGEYGD